MRAITIDDSRAIRSVIKKILKESGFADIYEAEDGVKALEKLDEIGPIEVALVDWNMPNMNGLDFVKNIRQKEKFNEMCIIMVTTETEMGQMVKALASGANEYLMKPFTKDGLLEKLNIFGLILPPAGV